MSEHHITGHARARMRQMEIEEGEVLSAIAYPIRTHRSAHRDSVTYYARRIAVVVADDGAVLTVMHADVEAGEYLAPSRTPSSRYRAAGAS